jgi:hypothetical protein
MVFSRLSFVCLALFSPLLYTYVCILYASTTTTSKKNCLFLTWTLCSMSFYVVMGHRRKEAHFVLLFVYIIYTLINGCKQIIVIFETLYISSIGVWGGGEFKAWEKIRKRISKAEWLSRFLL